MSQKQEREKRFWAKDDEKARRWLHSILASMTEEDWERMDERQEAWEKEQKEKVEA